MWQDVDINSVYELRLKTRLYFGVGAILKFESIAESLIQQGIDKILVMTGRSSYKTTGAWDVVEQALKKHGIDFVLCDQAKPNPDHRQVDEAVHLGLKFGVKAVLGIGGGSPIDSAKAAAILLEYPAYNCRDLYELKFTPKKALPVIAINLTHGTGSEINRFAVVSIPEIKQKSGIAYDVSYPIYAIDDPALMVNLPKFQTMATTVDALNHVFESTTSKVANPFTLGLGKEAVRLIHRYLPEALANGKNLEARYYLTYASMLAGMAFDNGRLHITHAMEHPLSAVNETVTHGHGLGMLMPAVVRRCFDAKKETILDVFAPILGTDTAMTADEAAETMKEWLHAIGVTETLRDKGFTEASIDELVSLVMMRKLVHSSPIEPTEKLLRDIYEESL